MSDRTVERWFFYQDTVGQWKWARLDVLGTVLAHSDAGFPTRTDCVEHASRSGYTAQRAATSAAASASAC